MDELKEAWGSLKSKTEDFTNLSDQEIKHSIRTIRSTGIMENLRQKVKYKLLWALFFALSFAIIIPFAFPLASQVLLTILLMAYAIGAMLLYQELQVLNKGVPMDSDLLTGLKAYLDRIRRVLRYEEMVSLTLYPVSASGGFFFGMQLVDREAAIMDKAWHWATLIVTVLLFTFIAHLATQKMNAKAFGQYLTQLEANIERLQSEESTP